MGQRSLQRKLLWQSLAETRVLSPPPMILDCGKSMALMGVSPLSIRWATPALRSLFQETAPTGPRGLPGEREHISGGANR